MRTALRQETRAPRLEDSPDYVRTRDDMVAANRELGALEARWTEVQRAKRGTDTVARIDAEVEEAALQISVRRARAAAQRAKDAHEDARQVAHSAVTDWHLARIREAVPPMLDALDAFQRGPYADVRRHVEDAIAAGVVPASLPLAELSLALAFGRTGGEVYVERCAQYLRRHGWTS